MTAGAAVARANSILNVLRGTSYTGLAGLFVKLHIGDPGSAGTANPSAVTTRNALTMNAPSGGSMTLSALGSYSMTTTETISHFSLWDASTAGNFAESWALVSPVPVVNGSTFSFSTLTLNVSPIAA